jgi:hypothetical protein
MEINVCFGEEMKIAIMGRTLDDDYGAGIANRSLIDKIIDVDRGTEYVVFYGTMTHFGRYKSYLHVREVLLRAPNKPIWDQILAPDFTWKQKDISKHLYSSH